MDNAQIIVSLAERVVGNVEKVIIGKRREVEITARSTIDGPAEGGE